MTRVVLSSLWTNLVEAIPSVGVVAAAFVIVLAAGFVFLAGMAMRAGTEFEGEITNRLLRLRIRIGPGSFGRPGNRADSSVIPSGSPDGTQVAPAERPP